MAWTRGASPVQMARGCPSSGESGSNILRVPAGPRGSQGFGRRRRTPLFYRNSTQQVEVREHLARAQDHGRQRVLGNGDGQAGLLADALVEVLQQSASAREHDAPVGNIGGEFGRGALEGDSDGIEDGGHAFGERVPDLRIVNRSEEHTSELQSRLHLVCRLLLEKKK